MPIAEVILWSKLKSKQVNGVKFRKQYSVGQYILDFYCPAYKLGIEVDGDSHFQDNNADKLKAEYIKKHGIELIRFTNTEIYNSLEYVIQKIMDNTTPNPSLLRRGNAHNYINFKTETLTDFSNENIERMYDNGFVMTRIGKGVMNQTISLRIKLADFELTSENRRILRKNEDVTLQISSLPLSSDEYNWKIHKLAKDFYTRKFGDSTFSAVKIKELIQQNHNFSDLFMYYQTNLADPIGYCICLRTEKILHYCYPFYDLEFSQTHSNLGMGMMLKAIINAQENGLEYVYIGSLTREQDKYKLQFKGLEKWNNDLSAWESILID